MNIPFIVVMVFGGLILYSTIAGLAHGIMCRLDIGDEEDKKIISAFWPVAFPISLIWKPFSNLTAGKSKFFVRRHMMKQEKKRKLLEANSKIIIPENAEIEGLEQYRKLAKIVNEYESKIPILEREG